MVSQKSLYAIAQIFCHVNLNETPFIQQQSYRKAHNIVIQHCFSNDTAVMQRTV